MSVSNNLVPLCQVCHRSFKTVQALRSHQIHKCCRTDVKPTKSVNDIGSPKMISTLPETEDESDLKVDVKPELLLYYDYVIKNGWEGSVSDFIAEAVKTLFAHAGITLVERVECTSRIPVDITFDW